FSNEDLISIPLFFVVSCVSFITVGILLFLIKHIFEMLCYFCRFRNILYPYESSIDTITGIMILFYLSALLAAYLFYDLNIIINRPIIDKSSSNEIVSIIDEEILPYWLDNRFK